MAAEIPQVLREMEKNRQSLSPLAAGVRHPLELFVVSGG
jgi:hypothetical protein